VKLPAQVDVPAALTILAIVIALIAGALIGRLVGG
jgi:hypothetical protein